LYIFELERKKERKVERWRKETKIICWFSLLIIGFLIMFFFLYESSLSFFSFPRCFELFFWRKEFSPFWQDSFSDLFGKVKFWDVWWLILEKRVLFLFILPSSHNLPPPLHILHRHHHIQHYRDKTWGSQSTQKKDMIWRFLLIFERVLENIWQKNY